MNRALSLAALVAALAAGGVALSVGDAVDVEFAYRDPDAGRMAHGLARCRVTSSDPDPLELDCGDIPEDAKIHVDTASAKYSTLGSPGKVSARNAACACGPKAKPNQCRVKLAGGGLRESISGEHLPPNGWEGQCVIKPCWELSEAIDELGVGYAMPPECRP